MSHGKQQSRGLTRAVGYGARAGIGPDTEPDRVDLHEALGQKVANEWTMHPAPIGHMPRGDTSSQFSPRLNDGDVGSTAQLCQLYGGYSAGKSAADNQYRVGHSGSVA